MKKIKKIAVAIIIDKGKVLLIKRKFEPYKEMWAPPGGGVDELIGETMEEAAKRETKEEIGLDIEIIRKVKVLKDYNKVKDQMGEIHLFLAKPLSSKIIKNEEVLEIRWFSFEDLGGLNLIPMFKKVILKSIK